MKSTIIIEEEILTAQKAADLLSVSQKVIERELRNGTLKGAKRLGKWYILKSDLVHYIETGKKEK